MKVYWDSAKEINVGAGRQLIPLAPGQPWEMDDTEALARIAQGDCSPFDPDEYAAALKAKAEPEAEPQDDQGGDPQPDQGSGAPETAAAVTEAPAAPRSRSRTKRDPQPDPPGGSE